MRPRNEVLLALGLLALLGVGAGALGRRQVRPGDQDPRASSFLTGPAGVRGLADALGRLHISVRRFRERSLRLATLTPGPRRALLVLEPSAPLSPPDVREIVRFAGGDLVVAGRGAQAVMRCFGYRLARERFDSVFVTSRGEANRASAPAVRRLLEATRQTQVADSSRIGDVGVVTCRVPAIASTDTLLLAGKGEPALVRLTLAESGRVVVLASDANLFRNRALRLTDAGPLVLGLFAGRYDEVVFEEYHHGYGASGSLAGSALRWSLGSPFGWAVWQLVALGVLALGFAAIRFGPLRAGVERRRRSPLEHLRALATALAAARGHDLAIGTLVRGLRRRLVPSGLRTTGDWRLWFGRLDRTSGTPRARRALALLDELTRPGQPPEAVFRAANAVEDLWQELKP